MTALDDGIENVRNIVVAVCTYNRHEPLSTLLDALVVCARRAGPQARVGVVIVDDSVDGNAEPVVARFLTSFELGLIYCRSGKQNISIARNLAVERAAELADWIAMTDDDCEPSPDWLLELLVMQERTKAGAVTGPMIRRVPAGSPAWLTEQPFLQLGIDRPEDGSELAFASTFNSMLSAAWLRKHPDIRFHPSLGEIGGEDMVFFRAAHNVGLKISFANKAVVYENEPMTRANLSYQLRAFFWHGNSSYISSVRSGLPKTKMAIHGIISLGKAFLYPVRRLSKWQSPQWRYSLALVLHAVGKLSGIFGVKVLHR